MQKSIMIIIRSPQILGAWMPRRLNFVQWHLTLSPFNLNRQCLGRRAEFFHGTFKFTYYTRNALERLEGEGTFKSRALWSVREGKGLRML